MAENSGIEWTDHTFNGWWGCTKVSPGCDHCYAERDAKRYAPGMVLWGEGSTRRVFGEKHWNQPIRWNRLAQEQGTRHRVFCASMADVFDKDAPESERSKLWALIAFTRHLDWLLLTKRIGNVKRMLPADWGDGYANVWLGISVVNQEEADRDIPKLIATPARIRFLSMEPLLGPISFEGRWVEYKDPAVHENVIERIDWGIVGGESGYRARPMEAQWAIDIAEQFAAFGKPFFFKQGSQANWPSYKDPVSFPPALRVREFPMAAT